MNADTFDQLNTGQEVADMFADTMLIDQMATSFTCAEVTLLADMLRAYGNEDAAEELINMHATGDEEGDEHYDLRLRNQKENQS